MACMYAGQDVSDVPYRMGIDGLREASMCTAGADERIKLISSASN